MICIIILDLRRNLAMPRFNNDPVSVNARSRVSDRFPSPTFFPSKNTPHRQMEEVCLSNAAHVSIGIDLVAGIVGGFHFG